MFEKFIKVCGAVLTGAVTLGTVAGATVMAVGAVDYIDEKIDDFKNRKDRRQERRDIECYS